MTLQLFLITLIIGLTSLGAAGDVKNVILIETMPVPAVLEHSRWFQFQLQEMGYEQNKNLKLTILKANGDRQLAEKLLKAELAGGNPDLVVTIATLASQTAAKFLKDTDVPILFFQVSDPVGAGLIKQINAPTGTNITGKVFTVNRDAKVEMVFWQGIKERRAPKKKALDNRFFINTVFPPDLIPHFSCHKIKGIAVFGTSMLFIRYLFRP